MTPRLFQIVIRTCRQPESRFFNDFRTPAGVYPVPRYGAGVTEFESSARGSPASDLVTHGSPDTHFYGIAMLWGAPMNDENQPLRSPFRKGGQGDFLGN
jgi:hypothetical protein